MQQVSIDAHDKIDKHQRYIQILGVLRTKGCPMSCTQISKSLNLTPNTISGRFTELLRDNHIYRVKRTRNKNGNNEWLVWINWDKPLPGVVTMQKNNKTDYISKDAKLPDGSMAIEECYNYAENVI